MTLLVVSAGRRRRIHIMLNAVVTEIPLELEPVTEDSFEHVAAGDHPHEEIVARIVQLFGSEPRRAIVD
jgi:hypothetical protein